MTTLSNIGQYTSQIQQLAQVSVCDVADQYGRIETDTIISIFDRYFRLGCISASSRVFELAGSTVIIDDQHSSIYQVRTDGLAVVVDSEDTRIQFNPRECILYDDSGLVIFREKTARSINFTKILDYIVDFDFENIANGEIKLIMGSSQIVEKTINDLDASIGIDIVPTEFLCRPLKGSWKVYNLTK
jgi:hypothetical protein